MGMADTQHLPLLVKDQASKASIWKGNLRFVRQGARNSFSGQSSQVSESYMRTQNSSNPQTNYAGIRGTMKAKTELRDVSWLFEVVSETKTHFSQLLRLPELLRLSVFSRVTVRFASVPYLGQGDLILCSDFYFLKWAILPRDKEKILYHTTVWRYFCPPFHHWVSMLIKASDRREDGGVKHNLAMLCYSRTITVGRARWVHDVIYSDHPWRTLAACFHP